jgi:hypothetical protein
MSKHVEAGDWPAPTGEAPRLGGQFGGMHHHGKGEPTTRPMRDPEAAEAVAIALQVVQDATI